MITVQQNVRFQGSMHPTISITRARRAIKVAGGLLLINVKKLLF